MRRLICNNVGGCKFHIISPRRFMCAWERLAQRIPVIVEIDKFPEGVELLVGTTASVLVMTNTDPTDADEALPPPAPTILQ